MSGRGPQIGPVGVSRHAPTQSMLAQVTCCTRGLLEGRAQTGADGLAVLHLADPFTAAVDESARWIGDASGHSQLSQELAVVSDVAFDTNARWRVLSRLAGGLAILHLAHESAHAVNGSTRRERRLSGCDSECRAGEEQKGDVSHSVE